MHAKLSQLGCTPTCTYRGTVWPTVNSAQEKKLEIGVLKYGQRWKNLKKTDQTGLDIERRDKNRGSNSIHRISIGFSTV